MDIEIRQTNTTEARTTLSHDDLVSVLGLAVKVKAGIASDTPGATVNVKIKPVDGTDEFTAVVDVLVDHNYTAPAAIPADVGGALADAQKADAPVEAPVATPALSAPVSPVI